MKHNTARAPRGDLRRVDPRLEPVPKAIVERFLVVVLDACPNFDAPAARAAFAKSDTLYEFDLPVSDEQAEQACAKIEASFEDQGIPGGTGNVVGTRVGWFVLYRNF